MAGNQVGHRPEPDRELARALLAAVGDVVDYAYLARSHTAGQVGATKAELVRSQTPLATIEPKLDGSQSRTLRDCLCTIGAKIRPDLSGDQASAWVGALMVAFSDLPPHVATKAAQRALHVPFEFPSQVEAKVRELAQEHMERIDIAIRRCDQLAREIADCLNPKPRLTRDPPPKPGEKTIPDDLTHTLQRDPTGMGRSILKLGMKLGYVLPDQLLPPDDPSLPQED